MGAGLTSSLVEERRGEERRHADGHADICPYMDMLMDMLMDDGPVPQYMPIYGHADGHADICPYMDMLLMDDVPIFSRAHVGPASPASPLVS